MKRRNNCCRCSTTTCRGRTSCRSCDRTWRSPPRTCCACRRCSLRACNVVLPSDSHVFHPLAFLLAYYKLPLQQRNVTRRLMGCESYQSPQDTWQLCHALQGPRTEAGLHNNISVGITYLEAWLGGNGCIPVHNLMEDAATAEIARTQVCGAVRPRGTAGAVPRPLTRCPLPRRVRCQYAAPCVSRRAAGCAHVQEAGTARQRSMHSSDLPMMSQLSVLACFTQSLSARRITRCRRNQIHSAIPLQSCRHRGLLGITYMRTHIWTRCVVKAAARQPLRYGQHRLSSHGMMAFLARARCGNGSSTARRCSRATSR